MKNKKKDLASEGGDSQTLPGLVGSRTLISLSFILRDTGGTEACEALLPSLLANDTASPDLIPSLTSLCSSYVTQQH